jgi:predicted nucleic acid-binding protein
MGAEGRTFVDTNVLVYAVDMSEPDKRRRAVEVLASNPEDLVISAQVLGEFYVTVTRKLSSPLPQREAAAAVERLSGLPTVSLDAELAKTAIEISRASQISYRDGLILAAARSAGCARLLSEDLSDGQVIVDIRIENPFRGLQAERNEAGASPT